MADADHTITLGLNVSPEQAKLFVDALKSGSASIDNLGKAAKNNVSHVINLTSAFRGLAEEPKKFISAGIGMASAAAKIGINYGESRTALHLLASDLRLTTKEVTATENALRMGGVTPERAREVSSAIGEGLKDIWLHQQNSQVAKVFQDFDEAAYAEYTKINKLLQGSDGDISRAKEMLLKDWDKFTDRQKLAWEQALHVTVGEIELVRKNYQTAMDGIGDDTDAATTELLEKWTRFKIRWEQSVFDPLMNSIMDRINELQELMSVRKEGEATPLAVTHGREAGAVIGGAIGGALASPGIITTPAGIAAGAAVGGAVGGYAAEPGLQKWIDEHSAFPGVVAWRKRVFGFAQGGFIDSAGIVTQPTRALISGPAMVVPLTTDRRFSQTPSSSGTLFASSGNDLVDAKRQSNVVLRDIVETLDRMENKKAGGGGGGGAFQRGGGVGGLGGMGAGPGSVPPMGRAGPGEVLAGLRRPISLGEAPESIQAAVAGGFMRPSGTQVKFTGGRGTLDPGSLYNSLVTHFDNSSIKGFVPKDGAKYGITTGSSQEWAKLALALGMQESSLRPGVHEGLYQFGSQDLARRGLGTDTTNVEAQTQAMVGEFEKIKKDGVIAEQSGRAHLGASGYFGPFRRPQEVLKHMGAAGEIAQGQGAAVAGMPHFTVADINKITGGVAAGRVAPGAMMAAGDKTPAAIIIHHTGGRGSIEGLQSTLHGRGLGVELAMDRDGNIRQIGAPGSANIMPESSFRKSPILGPGEPFLSNKNIIGIEVIAKNDADVTEAQKRSATEYFQKNYPGIPVFGHGEVNPGHKEADEGMKIVSSIRSERARIAAGEKGGDDFAGKIDRSITKQSGDGFGKIHAAVRFINVPPDVKTRTSAEGPAIEKMSVERSKAPEVRGGIGHA